MTGTPHDHDVDQLLAIFTKKNYFDYLINELQNININLIFNKHKHQNQNNLNKQESKQTKGYLCTRIKSLKNLWYFLINFEHTPSGSNKCITKYKYQFDVL